MSKKNEVAVVEEAKEVVTQEFVAPEFQGEAVAIEDITFPKIIALQPISTAVVDGVYSSGDVIDSITGEVIASTKKELEVYPLRYRKYYKVEKGEQGNKEWVRAEPINGKADLDLPWDFEENGVLMTRRPVLEIFLLAPSVSELPYLWRIQGMSYKSLSKTFVTLAFAMPQAQKKAPFVRSLMIRTEKETNEKGSYFVYKFKLGKLTDASTYALCNQWYETTKNTKIEEGEKSTETSEKQEDMGF